MSSDSTKECHSAKKRDEELTHTWWTLKPNAAVLRLLITCRYSSHRAVPIPCRTLSTIWCHWALGAGYKLPESINFSFSLPMKIGLGVYLWDDWIFMYFMYWCGSLEDLPSEKKQDTRVHYQFCTEGTGDESTPTRVYIWLQSGSLLLCSGYTWLVSTPLWLFKNWSTFGTKISTFKTGSPSPWIVLGNWGNLMPHAVYKSQLQHQSLTIP